MSEPVPVSDTPIPDWEFVVTASDVKGFGEAVEHPECASRFNVPPTLPVIASADQVRRFLFDVLHLDRQRLLHGQQDYEYFIPLRVGDHLRCRLHVVSDEIKQNRKRERLRIIVREIRMYLQPGGALALIERSTTIVRQGDGDKNE